MKKYRPRGWVPDTSVPENLGSAEEAFNYVGRTVCRLFSTEDLQGAPAAWHLGTVEDVTIEADTPYLQISYEDGDDEEFWWDDFRRWAVVCRSATCNDPDVLDAPKPEAGLEAHIVGSLTPRKRRAKAPGSTALSAPEDPVAQLGAPKSGGQSAKELESQPELGDEQGPDQEHMRPAVRRRLKLGDTEEHHDAGAAAANQRRAAAPPRRTLGGPVPFAPGHLHRIQMTNFMCHENIEFTFGKHVTFISGLNGSGKSALMQGMQACLGASARDTGRGNSLAGWVKFDKRVATITLEIWNTTEEECDTTSGSPFRHELYGSMIRIVRKITASEPRPDNSRTATASYQLFRANGSEVKPAEIGRTVAREVAALVDHFNVDASNPLIVITQDTARQFHSDKPSGPRCSKYEMYMDGTCLGATRDMLASAERKQALSEANMRQQHERLQKQQAKLKGLEKRQEQLRKMHDLKRQLADLELGAMWANVVQVEQGLRQTKQNAAAGPARVTALEAQVVQAERMELELQAQEKSLLDELENTRSEDMTTRLQKLQDRKRAAQRRRVGLKRKMDELDERLGSLQEERQAREAELANLEAEQRSEGLLRRVREHQEQVARKMAELHQVQADATELQAQRALITPRLTEAEAQRKQLKEGLDEAQTTLRNARTAHRQLMATAGGDPAARAAYERTVWGDKAIQLRAAAAARPRDFSKPPIGPVGLHLRRTADCDQDYARPLELALGGVMNTWLVNRREDSDVLQRMADTLRCGRPNVVVVPFKSQPHQYGSAPVVDHAGVRWRRVIDLVAPDEGLSQEVRATLINFLLDSGKAGNTVLVDSRDVGHSVARGSNPSLVERGVRVAFDKKGDSYEKRGGGMMTSPGELPQCRLASDNRAQLAESAREVETLEAEVQQAEAWYREAQAAEAALLLERTEIQARQTDLVKLEGRIRSELDALQEEEPAAGSEAQTADVLNRLQQTAAEINRAAGSQAGLESEWNNADREAAETEAEIAATQRPSSQYMQRREDLVARLNGVGRSKGEAAARLQACRRELEAGQDAVQQGQESINAFEERLKEATSTALAFCSREEGLEALQRLRELRQRQLLRLYPDWTDKQREAKLHEAMTSKALQRRSITMAAEIERAERAAGGDLTNVTLKVEDVRREVALIQSAIDAVTKKVTVMREAQQLRDKKYKELVKQIESIANAKFSKYMQRRNMTGTVVLDHEEQRLDLRVRKNSEQHVATSLMQLSGGERSFTTAAFLLAMGEVLNAPFRCMDEYDVFMDANAREMVTVSLLEFAWKINRGSQLILLSPQDTATLNQAFKTLVKNCKRDQTDVPQADFMKTATLMDPRSGGE